MHVQATAPGKIVLCGEYAVLEGAPAVAMAVDRRARVSVTDSAGPGHTVIAPGHTDREGRFTMEDGRFSWLRNGDPFPLLAALMRATGRDLPGCTAITLDTRSFYAADSGEKLGIGGSAALAAALAAVIRTLSGCEVSAFDLALAAHRELQHGVGSGIDVACSIHGGLLEYCMGRGRTAALRWPVGLSFAVFFSGRSADTAAKLQKLTAADRTGSSSRLAAAAERAAAAWRSASVPEILTETRGYVDALQRFSVDRRLGVFEAGHDVLVRAADEAAVVYKPCGAGGGDIGIALSDNTRQLAEFAERVAVARFRPQRLALDPAGVKLQRNGGDWKSTREPD